MKFNIVTNRIFVCTIKLLYFFRLIDWKYIMICWSVHFWSGNSGGCGDKTVNIAMVLMRTFGGRSKTRLLQMWVFSIIEASQNLRFSIPRRSTYFCIVFFCCFLQFPIVKKVLFWQPLSKIWYNRDRTVL